MTLFHRKAAPIAVYFTIWLIAILAFWLTPLSEDGIGYSLLVFYLMLPVATLIISYAIGYDKRWGKMKWSMPVLFGVMYMLVEYFTFNLANMLMNKTINDPKLTMILTGMGISLIAMGVGTFVQTHLKKPV